MASETKKSVRGDFSYLSEKLGQAISGSMFDDRPQTMVGVFEVMNRGIYNDDRPENPRPPYLEDENARRNFDRIKALIQPSENDGKDPRAKELGTWFIRAERMSREEKDELATCMWELFAHVDDYGRD